MSDQKTLYRCIECGVMSKSEVCDECAGLDLALQMVHVRTPDCCGKEWDDPSWTEPEWLQLIWEANDVASSLGHEKQAVFGKPDHLGEWWAGGSVEEYEHARVIHREDETVSIVSKTEFGAEMLSLAAKRLNMQTSPVVNLISGGI